jgi:hypothetical protein
MRLNKFNHLLEKYSEPVNEFSPYSGSESEVFFVESLVEREIAKKLANLIANGTSFKSVNIATKDQLSEIGMVTESNNNLYIFDEPTSYTKPAIVPA